MLTGNEPAFAKSAYVSSEGAIDHPQEGMTIRQHFASNEKVDYDMACEVAKSYYQVQEPTMEQVAEAIAELKVCVADALIAALNKTV